MPTETKQPTDSRSTTVLLDHISIAKSSINTNSDEKSTRSNISAILGKEFSNKVTFNEIVDKWFFGTAFYQYNPLLNKVHYTWFSPSFAELYHFVI